jgi:hypothetical protein
MPKVWRYVHRKEVSAEALQSMRTRMAAGRARHSRAEQKGGVGGLGGFPAHSGYSLEIGLCCVIWILRLAKSLSAFVKGFHLTVCPYRAGM